MQLGNLEAMRDWGHAADYCEAYQAIVHHNENRTGELATYVVATD